MANGMARAMKAIPGQRAPTLTANRAAAQAVARLNSDMAARWAVVESPKTPDQTWLTARLSRP